MPWKVVTAPDYEKTDKFSDVKSFLRLTDIQDNSLVRFLIASATRQIEQYTKRFLLTQTWNLWLDLPRGIGNDVSPWWSGTRTGHVGTILQDSNVYIRFDRAPISAINSIVSYDDDNNQSTLSSASYFLDDVSTPPRVALNSGFVWPTDLREINAFRIQVVGGYGDFSDVPEDLRNALRQQIFYLYENRCNGELVMPEVVKGLLNPYVIYSDGG